MTLVHEDDSGRVHLIEAGDYATYTYHHELKCWPGPDLFQAVASGRKPFEVRKDDRDYRVGDWLWLREWNPVTGLYGTEEVVCEVTYILRGEMAEKFGIQPGYCVLGLSL